MCRDDKRSSRHCRFTLVHAFSVCIINRSNCPGAKWFWCVFLCMETIFSLHVVCERLSVMQRLPESGKAKFVLKFLRTPCSEIWFRTPPSPPPPQNWNLGRSWHFQFWLSEHSPPPPPENWNLGRSWHIGLWLSEPPPPPPVEYVETRMPSTYSSLVQSNISIMAHEANIRNPVIIVNICLLLSSHCS